VLVNVLFNFSDIAVVPIKSDDLAKLEHKCILT
jgi:hypothetical protein